MRDQRMLNDDRPSLPAVRPTTALRDAVVDRLSAGFASGALDTDEFERRVTVAHTSLSAAEIEALTSDLPPAEGTALTAPKQARALVPAAAARTRDRALTVFGSATRSGRWTVPRLLEVRAVFGNIELDFREAVMPAGAVEVNVWAVFGNVEITVPPHLAIEATGTAIFGNFDQVSRAPNQAEPDAPLLRVTGTSVFGNAEIHMRLPAGMSRK
ncbi:MAG TPA: DUF1707 domain-containing protein [Polyangia bacterium]|jgi:hypothetical protein|nr:DUF1707 domain-containing protein [Polyangia bacterium]